MKKEVKSLDEAAEVLNSVDWNAEREKVRRELDERGMDALDERKARLEARLPDAMEKAARLRTEAHTAITRFVQRYAPEHVGNDTLPEDDVKRQVWAAVAGGSPPAYEAAVREAQRVAKEHDGTPKGVIALGHTEKVRRVLFDLDVAEHERDAVKRQIALVGEVQREAEARPGYDLDSRTAIGSPSQAEGAPGDAPTSPYPLTKRQRDHLETAARVLRDHPGMASEDEWRDAVDDTSAANAIKRALQRVAKNELAATYLPARYAGFAGGFQRLVADLGTGNLTGEDAQDN